MNFFKRFLYDYMFWILSLISGGLLMVSLNGEKNSSAILFGIIFTTAVISAIYDNKTYKKKPRREPQKRTAFQIIKGGKHEFRQSSRSRGKTGKNDPRPK